MDAAQPTHRKKSTDPAGEVARKQAPRRSRKPAYLQCKLALSHPQDAEEREADQVAREVANSPRAADTGPRETEEMISSAPAPVPLARRLRRRNNAPGPARQSEGQEEEVQMRGLARQVENEEQAVAIARRLRRQGDGEEEELQTRRLARAEDEEEAVSMARRLRRQADGEEEELQMRLARVMRRRTAQREEDDTEDTDVAADAIVDEQIEARIEARRGAGNPLADGVREDMEARFGQQFGQVGIHTDAEAAELCRELHARAFTVGNDVFFAPGEYAPETESGRELLAHELTHVVQQGNGVARIQARIEPAPNPPHEAGSPSQRKLDQLSQLQIPPIKQRHRSLYDTLASGGNLKRARGYARGRPAQIGVWRSNFQVPEGVVREKLGAHDITLPESDRGRLQFQVGSFKFDGTKGNLLSHRLRIPNWSKRGAYPINYQVDHVVELQVSGEHGTGTGNSIENMELLDQPANASSGAVIMNGIHARVDEYLATLPGTPDKAAWLSNHDIIFDSVTIGGGGNVSEGASSWWSKADIEEAAPLDSVRPLPETQLEGQPGEFVLASGPGGIEMGRYRYSELNVSPQGAAAKRVAGLTITSIALSQTVESAEAGTPIGTVFAEWDLPAKWTPNGSPQISLVGMQPYVGHLGPIPSLEAHFEGASDALFDEIEIQDGGLYAEGRITPTLPLIAGTEIVVVLTGNDIQFRIEYSPEEIKLNLPAVSIDEALFALAYSTRDGFGATGAVMFSVPNLGQGSLLAGVSAAGEFQASGQFNFDSELFDRAEARIWYRDRAVGGEGTLGIDNPDKIRGIRSAEITVGFGENSFTAEGSVQPDIPGVEEAGLSVSYTEERGLVIGGRLSLGADTPGIQSGSVAVTVTKRDGAWKVAADGAAVPAIPGVDSQLTVSYDDGAFTAGFSGAYRRGMLSGQVSVGASNRALDDQGQPTGEAGPDSPIIVYGSGQVTVQIAPWLQGTVGIRFAPDGEVTVSGEIGIPGAVEIFARRQIEKSLFNIAVQVPIVPGIVAEIGGGLSAQAGIGPGTLERLNLGITYNPAQEADTRVSGGAQLRVPADAGLRLSVRAGVGIGITGASVTGGLEVGGTLGVEGAAEAAVEVDWTPAQGLDLRANLSVHAQPSFTFDISGYVSARALGVSVYEERWQLASYTFGSDYRFGISLPVRYREGEPFEIGLDDVRFEVPNVDPGQILRGLIRRIV